MMIEAIKRPDIELSSWIGRTQTTKGKVSEQTAAMVHATFGTDGPAPRDGAPLPPLWHWYGFPPMSATQDLGSEGHPKLGGFLPPVPLERRMWAGGSLKFHAPLRVGETLTKHSRILNVVEKSGRTGGMVFVTVEHVLEGAAGPAVTERQDIVYLPIPEEFVAPPKKPAPSRDVILDQPQPISAALLFRYSAITFNAHRIHYDLQYAQQVEKYPGLVVHGPLQANLLMAAATACVGRAPADFSFRGIHPIFHDNALRIMATEDLGALSLCTVADQGHQGMQAKATWEI